MENRVNIAKPYVTTYSGVASALVNDISVKKAQERINSALNNSAHLNWTRRLNDFSAGIDELYSLANNSTGSTREEAYIALENATHTLDALTRGEFTNTGFLRNTKTLRNNAEYFSLAKQITEKAEQKLSSVAYANQRLYSRSQEEDPVQIRANELVANMRLVEDTPSQEIIETPTTRVRGLYGIVKKVSKAINGTYDTLKEAIGKHKVIGLGGLAAVVLGSSLASCYSSSTNNPHNPNHLRIGQVVTQNGGVGDLAGTGLFEEDVQAKAKEAREKRLSQYTEKNLEPIVDLNDKGPLKVELPISQIINVPSNVVSHSESILSDVEKTAEIKEKNLTTYIPPFVRFGSSSTQEEVFSYSGFSRIAGLPKQSTTQETSPIKQSTVHRELTDLVSTLVTETTSNIISSQNPDFFVVRDKIEPIVAELYSIPTLKSQTAGDENTNTPGITGQMILDAINFGALELNLNPSLDHIVPDETIRLFTSPDTRFPDELVNHVRKLVEDNAGRMPISYFTSGVRDTNGRIITIGKDVLTAYGVALLTNNEKDARNARNIADRFSNSIQNSP